MNVVVCASEQGKTELKKKKSLVELTMVDSYGEMMNYPNADAYMILSDDYSINDLLLLPSRPVFLNSVIQTLIGLQLPGNFARVNGWPGFIQSNHWEVAGDESLVKPVFDILGWQYTMVQDTVGMVAPRIVAMIINEAYHAYGEKVSTKDEIDIAMKLGTNYPYGPFEWASMIGIEKIASLITELYKENKLYKLAPELMKEVQVTPYN